jgi:hypothetical protein
VPPNGFRQIKNASLIPLGQTRQQPADHVGQRKYLKEFIVHRGTMQTVQWNPQQTRSAKYVGHLLALSTSKGQIEPIGELKSCVKARRCSKTTSASYTELTESVKA